MYTHNELVEFQTANSAEIAEFEASCVDQLSEVSDPDCPEFGYDENGDVLPF